MMARQRKGQRHRRVKVRAGEMAYRRDHHHDVPFLQRSAHRAAGFDAQDVQPAALGDADLGALSRLERLDDHSQDVLLSKDGVFAQLHLQRQTFVSADNDHVDRVGLGGQHDDRDAVEAAV